MTIKRPPELINNLNCIYFEDSSEWGRVYELIAKKWLRDGQYLRIEFNLDGNSLRVLENNE